MQVILTVVIVFNCFICLVLYIFHPFSIEHRAPSALMTFRLFHQPSRCCCFLTFRWISSLKLQTLPSAFWTGLGSASRRISGSHDFGWVESFPGLSHDERTPLHIVFLDSLPHLQKQQADDFWVVRVSGAQECIYVRFYWQYVCILEINMSFYYLSCKVVQIYRQYGCDVKLLNQCLVGLHPLARRVVELE